MQQLPARGPRLLHLRAIHRTRHVEHERHVARRRFGAREIRRWGERDQRKAVLTAWRVREDADGGVVMRANGNEQREIARVAADVHVTHVSVVAHLYGM